MRTGLTLVMAVAALLPSVAALAAAPDSQEPLLSDLVIPDRAAVPAPLAALPVAEPSSPPPVAYILELGAANAAGIVGGLVLATNTKAGWYSLTPVLVAAPLIHAFHGNPGRAGISLLAHAALVSVTIGALALDERRNRDSDVQYPVTTIFVVPFALVVTVGLDIFLALQPPASQPAPRPSPLVGPMLSFAPTGDAVLGLVGTF